MTYPTWGKVKSSTQKCQKVGDMFVFLARRVNCSTKICHFLFFSAYYWLNDLRIKRNFFAIRHAGGAGKPSAHQVEAHNGVERGPLFEQKKSRKAD